MRLLPVSSTNIFTPLVTVPRPTVVKQFESSATAMPAAETKLGITDPLVIYLAVGVTIFFIVCSVLITKCCIKRRKRLVDAYSVYSGHGLKDIESQVYDEPRDLVILHDTTPAPPPPPTLPHPSSHRLAVIVMEEQCLVKMRKFGQVWSRN